MSLALPIQSVKREYGVNAPTEREMFNGLYTQMAVVDDFYTSIVKSLEHPYFFFLLSTPCSSVSGQPIKL